MTEVQHLPETALTLVAGDNPCLYLYAADDDGSDLVTPGTTRREEHWQLPRHGPKVTRVRYNAMLNRLGKSCSQKVKSKRIKGLRVRHHGSRRMKKPYQILPRGRVHPRFAADRGVDHREESGRNLDHRDSTHERAGDESREISNHPATKSDDRGIPAEPGREKIVSQPTPALSRLVALTGRHREEFGC